VIHSVVHALLETQVVLGTGLHQWLGRLGDRYGSVLGLASDGGSLHLVGLMACVEELLHLRLAWAWMVPGAVLMALVIHLVVLARWLGSILFIQVLDVHAHHALAHLGRGWHLDCVHFGIVLHLG